MVLVLGKIHKLNKINKNMKDQSNSERTYTFRDFYNHSYPLAYRDRIIQSQGSTEFPSI